MKERKRKKNKMNKRKKEKEKKNIGIITRIFCICDAKYLRSFMNNGTTVYSWYLRIASGLPSLSELDQIERSNARSVEIATFPSLFYITQAASRRHLSRRRIQRRIRYSNSVIAVSLDRRSSCSIVSTFLECPMKVDRRERVKECRTRKNVPASTDRLPFQLPGHNSARENIISPRRDVYFGRNSGGRARIRIGIWTTRSSNRNNVMTINKNRDSA